MDLEVCRQMKTLAGIRVLLFIAAVVVVVILRRAADE